jgi:hypothetical protein
MDAPTGDDHMEVSVTGEMYSRRGSHHLCGQGVSVWLQKVPSLDAAGSTGGASAVRMGKAVKSSTGRVVRFINLAGRPFRHYKVGTWCRQVPSKFMQGVPQTGHRSEVGGHEAYHLRSGTSMGYSSLAATPATHAGRSLQLTSNLKATGRY